MKVLKFLMLPAFVIVVACAAAAGRADRLIDNHPQGGALGAIFGISAFCVVVGLGNLIGGWLS